MAACRSAVGRLSAGAHEARAANGSPARVRIAGYPDLVRFGVLGTLAAWTEDGRLVEVPEVKVRALLADLLLTSGSRCRRTG